MLEFRDLTLNDKTWIEDILGKSGYISADSAFGTMYVWAKAYNLKIAKYKGFLFRFYHGKGYGFPLGQGDITEAIELLIEHAKSEGQKFSFVGISESSVNVLQNLMKERFLFEHTRDRDDYIYRTYDLINLKGKKYHSKRNHISKFLRNNNWEYENITEVNKHECISLVEEWFSESEHYENNNLYKEKEAILLAISKFDVLGFKGGIIRVEGRPVAFTIGEAINSAVFVVHFEKALAHYKEAYAVINNEFAKRVLSEYDFINREEDLGIEGLRRAKLSYHPITLLRKYRATLR